MDKEKLKDLIITSSVTLLLGGLVALGTFGCHQLSKVSAEEEQPQLTQPLKASYDDNNYTITLTADELNNYTWNNLNTFMYNFVYVDNHGTYFDELSYYYNDIQVNWNNNYDKSHNGNDYIAVYLRNTDYDISFNYYDDDITDNKFHLYSNAQNDYIDFSSNLTFDFSGLNTYYNDFKQAIELDIQVNNPQYDFYLSSYQLNNNTYTYLANQINDNGTIDDFENTYLMYNNNRYVLLDFSVNDCLQFGYDNGDYVYYINFYLDSDDTDYSKFCSVNNEDNIIPFTNSVYFYNAEFLQDNLNAPVNWLSFLNSFISLLTGGLVTTASALGSGISSYVGSILVSGTSMSAFASVFFIFGGIALAFTLGRWVLNFITSLGNRNR